MFYVYILKSRKDKLLYVGSTGDLKKRIKDHNFGKVSSTRERKPLDLRYYEAYRNEYDTRKRERSLKLRGRALVQLKKRVKRSLK